MVKRKRKLPMRLRGRRVKARRDLRNLFGLVFTSGDEARIVRDDGKRLGFVIVSVTDDNRRLTGVTFDDVELLGPSPEKSVYRMADYVGRRVRLWRTIQTIGGDVFPAGAVMTVTSVPRGVFTAEGLTTAGKRGWVRKLSERDVELIDD